MMPPKPSPLTSPLATRTPPLNPGLHALKVQRTDPSVLKTLPSGAPPASAPVAYSGLATTKGAENSDVFPDDSVAVAVTIFPTGTAPAGEKVNAAFPSPSVVTTTAPSNRAPSPNPDGSTASLLKSSIRTVVFGTLVNVPVITVPVASATADVSTGKF